jgi:hypothetical protein
MADPRKARNIGQGDLLEILYGSPSKPEQGDLYEKAPLLDDEDDPVCTQEFALHSRGLDQRARTDRRRSL